MSGDHKAERTVMDLCLPVQGGEKNFLWTLSDIVKLVKVYVCILELKWLILLIDRSFSIKIPLNRSVLYDLSCPGRLTYILVVTGRLRLTQKTPLFTRLETTFIASVGIKTSGLLSKTL